MKTLIPVSISVRTFLAAKKASEAEGTAFLTTINRWAEKGMRYEAEYGKKARVGETERETNGAPAKIIYKPVPSSPQRITPVRSLQFSKALWKRITHHAEQNERTPTQLVSQILRNQLPKETTHDPGPASAPPGSQPRHDQSPDAPAAP